MIHAGGETMASPPRRPRASGEESPFEPPQAAPGAGGSPQNTADDRFEPPPGDDAAAGPEEAASAATQEQIDPDLLQIKQELEQRIFARAAPLASARQADVGGGNPTTPPHSIVGVGGAPGHRGL